VLVSHIQQPEIYEPTLAALRAFNSVLGGILALLVGFLVWPEKEPRQLAGALARALQRHADYALALAQEKSGDAASRDIVGLRRLACLSADNAEASLQRLQQNPVHRDRNVDTAVNLLNAMRRITAAGTVLEIQPALPPESPAASALRDYGAVLAHVLHPEGSGPVPEARGMAVPAVIADAEPALAAPLDRIAQQARQIRQLRDRVQRDPAPQ